jgi:hypothetical protein
MFTIVDAGSRSVKGTAVTDAARQVPALLA